MIIYDPEHKASFYEFGIQIPIKDSRAARTFENLKTHPVLGAADYQLVIEKDHRLLDRGDLERVHDPAYIDRLFPDALETEIIETTS